MTCSTFELEENDEDEDGLVLRRQRWLLLARAGRMSRAPPASDLLGFEGGAHPLERSRGRRVVADENVVGHRAGAPRSGAGFGESAGETLTEPRPRVRNPPQLLNSKSVSRELRSHRRDQRRGGGSEVLNDVSAASSAPPAPRVKNQLHTLDFRPAQPDPAKIRVNPPAAASSLRILSVRRN